MFLPPPPRSSALVLASSFCACARREVRQRRKPAAIARTLLAQLTLSLAMGHASIQTTADLYAHLDTRDLAEDVKVIQKFRVLEREEA